MNLYILWCLAKSRFGTSERPPDNAASVTTPTRTRTSFVSCSPKK